MTRIFTVTVLVLMYSTIWCQQAPKVLIIGIDGVRSDALEAANTPNLDALISQAIYSPDALNDDITISGPGWSAIICGVWSDKHLVTGNNFDGNNYEDFPSVIRRIEDYNSDFHTVSICHWGPINDHIIADNADFKLNVSADADVESQAAAYLSVNDPDLMFLHFDDVDGAGHGSGFTPDNPTYISTIEQTDIHVGGVLDAVRSRATYQEEDWLILVTTDHGGIGTSHGGNTFSEERVFFIASRFGLEPQVLRRDSLYEAATLDPCYDREETVFFSGDGSQIQVPDHPDFSFGTSRDFTVECRVRTSNSSDVSIVGNKDWDTGLNPGFVFSFVFPSGPEWKVNIGDGTNRVDLHTGGTIADNEWHTLSVTFDRDGMMEMYEDGVWLGSADISGIGDIDTGFGLLFGSDSEQDYPYAGYLSEVRVWDGVLTADEIANWHCRPLADTHSSYDDLLGYWPLMDSTADPVISDISGAQHDAMNIGATWQAQDSVLMEDFSDTPRLVDIPVTAMQHLCVPILEEWNLDGRAWLMDCVFTSAEDLWPDADIRVAPNPASIGQSVRLIGEDLSQVTTVNVYDSRGQFIRTVSHDGSNKPLLLDTGRLPSGNYLLQLATGDGRVKSLSLVLQ